MEQNWSPWGPAVGEIISEDRIEEVKRWIYETQKIVRNKIQVADFERGLRLCQKLYRQHAARQIQRTWDRYWYRPNETGESRAGKAGYESICLIF